MSQVFTDNVSQINLIASKLMAEPYLRLPQIPGRRLPLVVNPQNRQNKPLTERAFTPPNSPKIVPLHELACRCRGRSRPLESEQEPQRIPL